MQCYQSVSSHTFTFTTTFYFPAWQFHTIKFSSTIELLSIINHLSSRCRDAISSRAKVGLGASGDKQRTRRSAGAERGQSDGRDERDFAVQA